MSLKPIETNWRGYRFRSRTEARWAVALTEADFAFEYEKQGFELPSGWYLPDFWLPERKAWLEVKGEEPTSRELAVARELAKGSEHRVLFAVGAPDPDKLYFAAITGDGAEAEELFELPLSAYRAARAERFDGRPTPPRTPEKRRWW